MAKYLNAQTKFKCESGHGVMFSAQNSSGRARTNASGLLLETCVLKLIGAPTIGQCDNCINPATGSPPGACFSPVVSPAWSNETTLTVNKIGVLKSDCSTRCSLMGKIIPIETTFKAIRLNDESSPTTSAPDNKNFSPQGMKTKISDQGATAAISDQGAVTVISDQDELLRNAADGCKDCDRAGACEYINAPHTLPEIDGSKNAQQLAANMKAHCPDYHIEFDRIKNLSFEGINFSVAHHHLIPANQCFAKYPKLVKLGNFYGYDINNHRNGILLPTSNMKFESLNQRLEAATYAMIHLGLQWHLSHHNYSMPGSIDNLIKSRRPLKSYKAAVDELLRAVEYNLVDQLKCPLDNRQDGSKKFHDAMNAVDNMIRRKLLAFKDNPRGSYSFFVSKEAIYLAYRDELRGHEELLFKGE